MLNESTKPKKLTAEELIQLSLGSNEDWINKQDSRRQQESLTKARRTPSVVLSQSDSASAPVENTDPSLPQPGTRAQPGAMAENDVQKLTQSMAVSMFGWSGPEWDALYELVQHESGWDPWIRNPNSSAANLFQFLDSTRANYNLPIDAPVEQQIRAGLQYVADRYGSPTRAYNHWQSRVPINGEDVGNWY